MALTVTAIYPKFPEIRADLRAGKRRFDLTWIVETDWPDEAEEVWPDTPEPGGPNIQPDVRTRLSIEQLASQPVFASVRCIRCGDTSDAIALCTAMRFTMVGGGVWELEASYEAPEEKPWNVPIPAGEVKAYELYSLSDLDGKPVVNSAGDFFQRTPPHFAPKSVVRLTVLHTTSTFNEARYLQLMGTVPGAPGAPCTNVDFFGGFDPGELLFQGCQYRKLPRIQDMPVWAYYDDQFWYFEVIYQFEVSPKIYKPDGYFEGGYDYTWIQNAGYRYLDSNGKLNCFRDGKGVAHGKPYLLDGTGHKQDIEGHPENYVPSYMAYRFVQLASFGSMFPFITSFIAAPPAP